MYTCGKLYACNVWFKEILRVINVNKNSIACLKLNYLII